MSDFNTKQVILVATTRADAPTPEAGGFIPLMMYGGVGVAVIIAMTYFSGTLLHAIADLIKIVNKNKK
ncbi:hypothetical protein [Iningainema tapete]|uniref:Uncharacterized protein n=1 Tax=Iningainema tapete BLCC-T55 TaxID=2748662 RepID=A0A8J6XH68_9CYAN|nr:hypothetical protein [Iningainema tapete]MBD2776765.1 hypothetical protein [Iningainema tapete BLCC-T55]